MDDVSGVLDRAFRRVRLRPVFSIQILRRPVLIGAILALVSTVAAGATTNTLPTFTSVTVSQSVVNEGQSVTLTGTFTDPDAADWHHLHIDWRDGPPRAHLEKIMLPPGQLSFQVTHTYHDNLSPTIIWVIVLDKQIPTAPNDNVVNGGNGDVKVFPIQVKNVAPGFGHGVQATYPHAKLVVIEGDVVEPGSDTVQVAANWNDKLGPGPSAASLCTVQKHHYRCEHTYQWVNHATVSLLVKDDDGAQGTTSIQVQIP